MSEQLTIFDILDEPVEEVDKSIFDNTIRAYVMAAIKNMGYTEYFNETTEISIVSMSTSATNKYFPEGCAMMHIYVIGDKATTDIFITNRFALDNHRKWVKGRNYDHRYYKKWHSGMMLHEERLQPNRYTLDQYRSFHFRNKIGDTWFQTYGYDKIITDFYKWGF